VQNSPSSPSVLLVEDDPLAPLITEAAVSRAGFAYERAGSGEAALAAFLAEPSRYQALVTEARPKGELTGWQLARKIREAAPRFPVVYLTGPAADQWWSHGVPAASAWKNHSHRLSS
jgi:CheY-like chemotaxis protein